MSNPNLQTAAAIADKLRLAEDHVSLAFSSVAELIAYLPQARQDAGFAPGVGHALLAEGASALQQLSQAQSGLDALHRQIAAVGRKMGIDVSATGPLQKEPQEASIAAGPVTLVREAA